MKQGVKTSNNSQVVALTGIADNHHGKHFQATISRNTTWFQSDIKTSALLLKLNNDKPDIQP